VPSKAALLLIDFVNTLDFGDGGRLARRAVPAARTTQALKQQAHSERIPTIYVNDNFGDWSGNFEAILDRCRKSKNGNELAALLQPSAEDLSILKPRHSAFYGTPLEFLLDELQVDSLILTGLQAHICILFTAHDAYLRRYRLWIPGDCVASSEARDERSALEHMAKVAHADVTPYGGRRKQRLAARFGMRKA
jgi:nicotinamidase-related amidase